jgi:hypothetical protein
MWIGSGRTCIVIYGILLVLARQLTLVFAAKFNRLGRAHLTDNSGYTFGRDGALTCDDPSKAILTYSECEIAASALAGHPVDVLNENWAGTKGCHVQGPEGGPYLSWQFNNNMEGEGTPGHIPICRSDSAGIHSKCSDDWCQSPGANGGHDCYAGKWNEPCDCTNGEARLSGETVEYSGETYYKYTCCTGGSNVGHECGDYSDTHFYGVIVGIPIAGFVFLCCVVYASYIFCCKGSCCCCKESTSHPGAIYYEPAHQQSVDTRAVHAPKEQTQAEAGPSAPSYDTEVHDVRDTSGGKAPFGKAEKMQAGAMAYQVLPCDPQSASQLGTAISVEPAAQPGATVVTTVPAAPVQPSAQMPGEPNKIKVLKELKELLDAGALTQEEFDIEKKKILEGPNGVWNA